MVLFKMSKLFNYLKTYIENKYTKCSLKKLSSSHNGYISKYSIWKSLIFYKEK